MTANFALLLGTDRVALFQRKEGAWLPLGRFQVEEVDLDAAMAALREEALARAGAEGLRTLLVFGTPHGVETRLPDPEATRAEVALALAPLLPCPPEKAVIDRREVDGGLRLRALPRRLLREAEDFAAGHGLRPIGFAALWPGDPAGPPAHLGPTESLPEVLGPTGVLLREVQGAGAMAAADEAAPAEDRPAIPEVTPVAAASPEGRVATPAGLAARRDERANHSAPPIAGAAPRGRRDAPARVWPLPLLGGGVAALVAVLAIGGWALLAPEDADVAPDLWIAAPEAAAPADALDAPPAPYTAPAGGWAVARSASGPLAPARLAEALPTLPGPLPSLAEILLAETPPHRDAAIWDVTPEGLIAPTGAQGSLPTPLGEMDDAPGLALAVLTAPEATSPRPFAAPSTDAPATGEASPALAALPEAATGGAADLATAPDPARPDVTEAGGALAALSSGTAQVPTPPALNPATAAAGGLEPSEVTDLPAQVAQADPALGLPAADDEAPSREVDTLATPPLAAGEGTAHSPATPEDAITEALAAAGLAEPSRADIPVNAGSPAIRPRGRATDQAPTVLSEGPAVPVNPGTPAILPRPRPGTASAPEAPAYDPEALEATLAAIISTQGDTGPRPRNRPEGATGVILPGSGGIEDLLAEVTARQAFVDPSDQAVAASRRPDTRPDNFATVVANALLRQQRAATPTPAARVPEAVSIAVPQGSGSIPTSVARAATQDSALPMRDVALVGVFGTPGARRALVRLPGGRIERVAVGDSLDGGRVSTIGQTTLNYVKRGRTLSLEIPGD